MSASGTKSDSEIRPKSASILEVLDGNKIVIGSISAQLYK